MAAAGEICVAHLVRHANDIKAFGDFLDSYKRHPAGVPHELLILFKGFGRGAQTQPYDRLLEGLPHKRMFLSDAGFDVKPYLAAAQAFPHRFFAFLNSFSKVLHAGWLEIMYRHALRPGIGLVGATGSHQSILSDFADLKPKHQQLNLVFYKYWYVRMRSQISFLLHVRGRYPAFPNYHVRTNAFLVPRAAFLQVRPGPIRRKWHAYRFESSARSLTRQIARMGLEPVVVGRDGRAYPKEQWPEAKTFWIEEQQNLLVSDNQTRAYAEGIPVVREELAFHAWHRYPDGRPRSEVPPVRIAPLRKRDG